VTRLETAVVGIATSKGNREYLADAAAWHLCHSNGVLAASVIDGMGNDAVLAEIAPVWAMTATRIGARYGALPGVLACSALVCDPVAEFPEPDGVMALAVCRPGEPAVIAHVGDCRCHTWDGESLVRWTEDHSKGNRMRYYGATEEHAKRHDSVPVATIARATHSSVGLVEVFEPVIVLTSDGVHDVLAETDFTRIVREHADDPESCAKALVEGAREIKRYDDATALVIYRPDPPDPETGTQGR